MIKNDEQEGFSESVYSEMDRNNINISDMKQMQTNLRIAKGWTDTAPSDAKDHLLYMIEEMGEVVQIIKKKGIDKIMSEPEIRALAVEEITDVMMYYVEVLNRLQITPEEFSQAYVRKHLENLGRDYKREWERKIVDEGKGIDD